MIKNKTNKMPVFTILLLSIAVAACGKEVDKGPISTNFLTDNSNESGDNGNSTPQLKPNDDVCGNVYNLEAFRATVKRSGLSDSDIKLPHFPTLEPFAGIKVENFEFAPRNSANGFHVNPIGMTNWPATMLEWYGMSFNGKIEIAADGVYSFGINSDDGAKLYIDGHEVVDNDGLHAPAFSDGNIFLTAGSHQFQLDYFQGPKVQIALELVWKTPGTATYEYVPASALSGWCLAE